MPTLKKGEGWDIVLVPSIVATLACKHRVRIPSSWIGPNGNAGRIQCNEGACRRITEDVVLEGWEGMPNG